MNTFNKEVDDNAYNVPHISAELAEYLKETFSADKQIQEGLLSDTGVVRSESYLLGFLAGLGYAQSIITTMVTNQDGQYVELEDVTDNYLNS